MVEPGIAKKEKPRTGCLLTIGIILAFMIIVLLLAAAGGTIFYFGLISGAFVFGIFLSREKRIFHIIALVLGICLLAAGGFVYFDTSSFVNNSILTEGVCLRYNDHGGSEDDIATAVIEFKTKDGDFIQFEDRYVQMPRTGEKLQVVYNPLDPSEARIYRWAALWILPLTMFCVSIAAIILAVYRLRKNTKNDRSTQPS